MAQQQVRVLIIDEDTAFLRQALMELSVHFTVYVGTSGEEGLRMFSQVRPQVVIVDAGITDVPFTDFLKNLEGLDGAILWITTSRNNHAMEAIRQGITSHQIDKYFSKPVNFTDLVGIIEERNLCGAPHKETIFIGNRHFGQIRGETR